MVAEALGTGLLLTAVVGSGIMAQRLCGANAGLSLLCNTLASAASLGAWIACFAPVSGAHFNPVVSLVLRLRGELTSADFLRDVLAQCVGAVLGVWAAHWMFDLPVLQLGSTARAGAAQLWSEVVASFALLLVILGVGRSRPQAVPWAVACTIAGAYWFSASTSFANPAASLARSLSDSFAGIRPRDVPGFALAQVVGALLAWVVDHHLFEPSRAPADAESTP